MRGRTTSALVGCVALVALACLPAATALGADEPPRRTVDNTNAALFEALQRDLGLGRAEGTELLERERAAAELARRLETSLGAEFGGAWVEDGKVGVAATSAAAAERARAGGAAETLVVRNTFATLKSIKQELDDLGQADPTRLSQVTEWGIDPRANRVVVGLRGTARVGAVDELVARRGDAVRVEEGAGDVSFAWDYLDGGDPMGNCSVGFNAYNSTGVFVLTAGHCGAVGKIAYSKGVKIGPYVQSFFPTYDDALIRNDNTAYWAWGPWVAAYDAGDNAYNIRGVFKPYYGMKLCKSGKTTKITCGKVTGTNWTVNYPEGAVYGLVRNSACVEPGDSGGANYMPYWNGVYAMGMTSGMSYVTINGQKRCLSAVGQQNKSYFQPAVDSIAYYQVTIPTVN